MERALRLEVSQGLNRRKREITETIRQHVYRFGEQPSNIEDLKELARDVDLFKSRYSAAGTNNVERIQILQELLAKIFKKK